MLFRQPAQRLLNIFDRGFRNPKSVFRTGENRVVLQVCLSEGHEYSESGSLAQRTLHPNRTAMHLHHFPCQCEADTAAFMASPARVFDAAESIKYMGKILGGDPCPGIRHRKFCACAAGT